MNEDENKETTTPNPDEGQQQVAPPINDKTNEVTDAELEAKALKKANLDKAIEEAEEKLRQKREAAKVVQSKEVEKDEDDESDAKIDFNDPAAKAWDKHIRDNVSPISNEREAEKAEIRKFTIKEFLTDKPALARDPEKVKELIDMYDRIKSNTGLTKEGVLLDLGRAFGALYHEQLSEAAKTQRFEKVKEMELFSSPAVDQGATGYINEKQKRPNLSQDDLKILQNWGMTPEQWYEMKEKESAE